MNIVETSAPIKIEDLKKFFEDKNTFFYIDYTESILKGEKLLIYIGNLDIPCDIKINSIEETIELVTAYLETSALVNIPVLEHIVISLLLQKKEILELINTDIINLLAPQLEKWTEKLESLELFNIYTIQDENMKKWVSEENEESDEDSLAGINFVSLLKHAHFYDFYQKQTTKPKYYSAYFNRNMFKGSNLYAYWANENNPLFLLTFAIASGNIDVDTYIKAVKELEEAAI
jgi:hypothetical protein